MGRDEGFGRTQMHMSSVPTIVDGLKYPLVVPLCLHSILQESRWLSWIRCLAFGYPKLNEMNHTLHVIRTARIWKALSRHLKMPLKCAVRSSMHLTHKNYHVPIKWWNVYNFGSFLSKKASVLWRNSRGKWCLLKAGSWRINCGSSLMWTWQLLPQSLWLAYGKHVHLDSYLHRSISIKEHLTYMYVDDAVTSVSALWQDFFFVQLLRSIQKESAVPRNSLCWLRTGWKLWNSFMSKGL